MGSGTATQVSVRDCDARSVPTLKNDSPVNDTSATVFRLPSDS